LGQLENQAVRFEILDYGYIEFIEAWGRGKDKQCRISVEKAIQDWDYEVGIIEAARQSTQGSFRGWEPAECSCDTETNLHRQTCNSKTNPGDARLLSHLYKNNHATPFEFAGMVIEVQAPIFVFREWHRHRTQSYNEMSARYAPIPDFKYTPTMDRLMQVNTPDANRQAGNVGGVLLSADNAMRWLGMLEYAYQTAERAYQFGLQVGVAKELARCPMPVGNYSRMRAQANLRNWISFLTLRSDPNAQYEIRQFANAVGTIISKKFPQTYRLFREKT
jgi:thymidylate synthase (FAD)